MVASNSTKIEDKRYLKWLKSQDFASIVERFGTPTGIFFKERLVHNCAFLKNQFKAFRKKRLFYALKANYNPGLLAILRSQGIGAEVMSGFELLLALHVGFKPKDIVFNGVGKTDEELKLAVEKGVGFISVDSLSEIRKLKHFKKRVNVLIRCHPKLPKRVEQKLFVKKGSKLGLSIESKGILQAIEMISDSKLQLRGFLFHIASRRKDFKVHELALESIIKFYEKLPARIQDGVKVIDAGGGFESLLFIKKGFKTKKEVSEFFNKNGIELFAEPGRSLVNDAGLMLTKVVTEKNTGIAKYLVVDAATNYLIPLPAAYYPVASQKKGKKERYAVVDGICSVAGTINKNVKLPKTNEGDVLLVLNCGAYTYNMFEHFYSLRPAVVLWNKGRKTVLNKKETFSQALRFLKN